MWTAVTLAALVIAGCAAYATWAVSMVSNGAPAWPFVLGLPVVYLAVPFLFTCLWVAMGWWLQGQRPGEVKLRWGARLRLFAGEFRALSLSAPKMIFYRALVRDPPPGPADLPVLLVHGLGCNAGVWSGFMAYLAQQGIAPVYALSYGPPLAPAASFAEQVERKIDAIREATGAKQVVLVGHSMGGLVSLAYLRRYGGTAVRALIAIGTPFHGSRHAYMMFGPAVQDLRPGSAFLSDVDHPGELAAQVRVVSLWSWHDSMVTPQTSSRLAWAHNIPITGVAHNALLGDRGVWALVAEEIRKAKVPATVQARV